MRHQMVQRMIELGITDNRVLQAMSLIPRHFFLDESFESIAYQDRAFPIDSEQTISNPYTVAIQSELLKLQEGEKVLEIGTGSGYQTAILCSLNLDVYSIERHASLHHSASHILQTKFGFYPQLILGDGHHGIPHEAPFDKMIITAASDSVPNELLEQLKVGGIMVLPMGGENEQILCTITKTDHDSIHIQEHQNCSFVPFVRDY